MQPDPRHGQPAGSSALDELWDLVDQLSDGERVHVDDGPADDDDERLLTRARDGARAMADRARR